jgi:hypothetical protein
MIELNSLTFEKLYMKKYIILFFTFLFSINSYSQTYYNPSNNVNLTITIKESYKPVDYSKIGRDFNTMIQNELQRRENLKRYYDEIYFQTKNSVYSSTVLTSDNLLNSKILMVQSEVIRYLEVYNRSLKSGMMKPDEYESNVRNIYYKYMNTNQVFLQIVQFKYNKDLQLGDQTKINEHNKLYTNTLNSIDGFRFNNSEEIEFVLNGLIYPNTTINSLYDFVRSSSEGEYETYKTNWDDKLRDELISIEKEQKRLKEEMDKNKVVSDRLFQLRKETFDYRKMIFLKLSEKERKKFRQEEKEYFIQTLENDVKDHNKKLTSKKSKYILKSIFTVEDSEFRFVNMFYWNGQDVLLNPSNYKGLEVYFNILMGFYKSKSPNN